MPPTHYDTLGVSPEASHDEIKTAFRTLSKATHPDVAGPEKTKQFQEISHAAGVLTDKVQREAYDLTIRVPRGLSPLNHIPKDQRPSPSGSRYQHPAGMQGVLATLFRPRNMVLGLVGLGLAASVVKSFKTEEEDHDRLQQNLKRRVSSHLVQAWKNPQTGSWEQPAPWDPLYKQLRPRLQYVPREQVRLRSR